MNHRNDDTSTLRITRPSWMDQQTWARIKTDTEALLARLVEQVHDDTASFSWHDVVFDDAHFKSIDEYDLARDDITPITAKAAREAALRPEVGALLLWNRTKDLEHGELYMLTGQTRVQELQVIANVSWMVSCGTVYAASRVGMGSYKERPDFRTRIEGDTYLGWIIPNDRDVAGMRR